MRSLFVFLFSMVAAISWAQSNQEAEVMQVVSRVFEAMRRSDSTLLKSCFTNGVRMSTVFTDKEGVTQFREGDLSKFVQAVGTPKSDVWHEPIWNEQVKIDGPLAAVWVDYAFYVNNTFLHCGVDAFHLVKTAEGWKIFNLVDTRRKEGCELPEAVRKKHEGG